ncbi:bifunctional adenosylcobinamide kinase/adenosylcobinamide-phosphate guanylyltransferase [Ureibacillus sp. FSL K6-8385]|uniref:bifunctional adenosylcobinamide kinase/adenosylcobinamide-phosphate guanylyltransferase n=1 Tax=Ureibacillus TaxID=160795 RepID=UPI001FE924BA|nr:bifunctional adenosylcobinamide kinase/adenosylcobinamide-phosphate guanylyltransferase [Ureibacillus terrenus]MED3661565.1 bifunctional adenosylcobinamide kinase/adenosylcobinamide-phosphate guanylyltransferase [Ureibacillus terrenus]MED3763876.1 bifunctional adenosylcobinamide kinase/adenosylcobinamide-phosphate guanylyltransferase [Ureibacillus terrenus]
MGKIIFITGGVRSGKSAFAETYAKNLFRRYHKGLYYIASGVPFDEEMKKRILRHQQDREQSHMPWATMEIFYDLPGVPFQKHDVVLWDCITTWLNNILYHTESVQEGRMEEILKHIGNFQKEIMGWKREGAMVLLVSNEVLDEPASPFEEVHLYRKLIGKLHQWIVSVCDEAYELDYGISVRKK